MALYTILIKVYSKNILCELCSLITPAGKPPMIAAPHRLLIADYRGEHGMSETLDDLLTVSGIGPAALEKLKEWAYAE